MRTQKEFISDLVDKNIYFTKGLFRLDSEYKGVNDPIFVSTKYGKCKTTPNQLLKGNNVNIKSALYQHSYFLEMLKEKNEDVYYDFIFLDRYKTNHGLIRLMGKYGIVHTTPNELLKGKIPTIQKANCKNHYFKNQAEEIHGSLYDYSIVKYVDSRTKVEIICEKHGKFLQTPSSHLEGNGCPNCSINSNAFSLSKWVELAEKSKKFDSFKLYFIKLFNDNEEFYKIGRTYTKLNRRLNQYPYTYEIIDVIESFNAELIYKMENHYLNQHKFFRYTPKIRFKGDSECFKKLEI